MRWLLLLPFAFILFVTPMFVTPMADDLLVEGFEQSGLPPDWQVWEDAFLTYSTWYTYYGPDGYNYSHSGNGFVAHFSGYCNPYALYTGDSNWLVTPTLDMSDYENLSFSCWYKTWTPQTMTYGKVRIVGSNVASPDNDDFTELLDMGIPPQNYENRVVDVSIYDSEPSVTFAIHYWHFIPFTHGYPIRIDDVLVTGDAGTNIESASLGGIKAIYK